MNIKYCSIPMFCNEIKKDIVYSYDIMPINSANRGIIGTNIQNVMCSRFDECNKNKCKRRNPYGKEDYAVVID